ncbi:type II toxin-antitoxin system HipA family toxin YjjJ [Piscinibacter sp.]|uniref:type II toxin-antitoxin system HipA family toxin YjjJ n=1 Tax=Piscinibacter sp. TaxID=1903157 RepID=UPI002F425C32
MRPRNLPARQELVSLLRRGPLSAPDISQALKVSPRTALRLIDELGPLAFRAGAASRRRYALRRPLRGDVGPLRLFTVDPAGKVSDSGEFTLVEPTGSHCQLGSLGWPVDSASREGWWEGLPYPFYDMQPQGFLGRGFARREHQSLEVSSDPRAWSDDDVAFVLSRRGADTAGNLILGESALRLFQAELAEPIEAFRASQVGTAYPSLADTAVAMGVAGSSAAGEFPKFTTLRDLPGSATPHVIVKFSGRSGSDTTQRWSDLLMCEHLALQHLADLPGVRTPATRVLKARGRTFVESERFDRHGRFGRSPVISLDALSAHLLGLATQDWRVHAKLLSDHKLLSPDDVLAIQRLWWFGRLIANSDMHLGNLSFVPEDGRLRLAPAYDMLPMAYAPLAGGEVAPVRWSFELPLPAQASAWRDACGVALKFWGEAAADRRISDEFRAVCRENLATLARLAETAA